MMQRILGVFKLNAATFEEVEHDPSATVQAAMLVAIAAVFSGIGMGMGTMNGGNFFGGFMGGLLNVFLGWLLTAGVSFFVGTKLFGGKGSFEGLLRTIGFAYVTNLLGIIPCVGGILALVWSMAASFIAVRQGLELDNMKTLFTIIISLVVLFAAFMLIGMVFGTGAALLGGLSGGSVAP